jgi:two-component system CheB/CheR fusion protein
MTAHLGDAPRLRVLAVDNYRDAADSLAALLRLWGHECDVAYDGPAAVQAAEERSYDVIFAELSLPGFSGFYLAQRVRRGLGDCPVLIALTGFSSAEHREYAAECGYDHFLVKPGDPDRLRTLMEGVAQLPVG